MLLAAVLLLACSHAPPPEAAVDLARPLAGLGLGVLHTTALTQRDAAADRDDARGCLAWSIVAGVTPALQEAVTTGGDLPEAAVDLSRCTGIEYAAGTAEVVDLAVGEIRAATAFVVLDHDCRSATVLGAVGPWLAGLGESVATPPAGGGWAVTVPALAVPGCGT